MSQTTRSNNFVTVDDSTPMRLHKAASVFGYMAIMSGFCFACHTAAEQLGHGASVLTHKEGCVVEWLESYADDQVKSEHGGQS